MSRRPESIEELRDRFNEEFNPITWADTNPAVRAKHLLDVGEEWLLRRDQIKALVFIGAARRQLEVFVKKLAEGSADA